MNHTNKKAKSYNEKQQDDLLSYYVSYKYSNILNKSHDYYAMGY